MKIRGRCKLCRQTAKLVDSHVIPERSMRICGFQGTSSGSIRPIGFTPSGVLLVRTADWPVQAFLRGPNTMPLDNKLLLSLLRQEEGTALDFKSDQYPFDNADTGQKAKLLKDILAFANSWRQTTAYILIGVEEVKGGLSSIVGVQRHLDDANLHQFVNGKTQRAVDFSYAPLHTKEGEIAYIEIPLQERPIYLKKAFGSLKENTVFVRDGSSAREATPEEIAEMGAEQALGAALELELEWADPDSRTAFPSPMTVNTTILRPLLPDQTFAPPERPARGPLDLQVVPDFTNREYSQEVIQYSARRNFYAPLGLRVLNRSGTAGKRVRLVGSFGKAGGVALLDSIEDPPQRFPILGAIHNPHPLRQSEEGTTQLRDLQNRWELQVDFGDVRPGESVWTRSPICFGSEKSVTARLEGVLFADNLPDPIPCSLDIRIEVESRPMTVEDVKPYLIVEVNSAAGSFGAYQCPLQFGFHIVN